MKFAVVIVLVALALGANASVIPLGWPGSVVLGHPGAIVVGHPPAAITVAQSPVPVVVHGGPHVVGSPVQIVAGPHVHPAVVPAVVPGGVAVSQTRGAVHVAPLAGHAQSVVQSNLQPAPGTI